MLIDGTDVRDAQPEDVPALLVMINELAAYEPAGSAVQADADCLTRALFTSAPKVFAQVACLDGAIAGMAIWYLSFSTWLGCHGIYLEDLYVRPAARRRGLGRALLANLAAIAADRGYARLDWAVLNWNTPAIDFYRTLGAEPQSEWTTFRLTGRALNQLAEQRDC